jgi:hypothetical protein
VRGCWLAGCWLVWTSCRGLKAGGDEMRLVFSLILMNWLGFKIMQSSQIIVDALLIAVETVNITREWTDRFRNYYQFYNNEIYASWYTSKTSKDSD